MSKLLLIAVTTVIALIGISIVGKPAAAPEPTAEENFGFERAALLQMLDVERECVARSRNRAAMRACSP